MAHNIEYINFRKKEIVKEMKNLNKQKASKLAEISYWILSECTEELYEPLQIMSRNSIEQGKL